MRMESYYSVVCPSCHGKRYVEGILCECCGGVGAVVIPDPGISKRARKTALCFIVFVAVVALALWGVR